MLRRFSVNYALFSVSMDLLVVAGALLLADYIRPALGWLPWSKEIGETGGLPEPLFLVIPALWVSVLSLLSTYDPKARLGGRGELRALLVGSAFAGLAAAGLLYLTYRDVSRWLFLIFVFIGFCSLVSWRVAARGLATSLPSLLGRSRRVLLVGGGPATETAAHLLASYSWTGLHLLGYVADAPLAADLDCPYLGTPERVRDLVVAQAVDDVVVALPPADPRLGELTKSLLDLPVYVRVVPDCIGLALGRPAIEDLAGIPLVNLRAGEFSDGQRLLKRAFDLGFSAVFLVVALPVLAAIALAVRLDSTGPALFRQQRVGENGRLFTMYKFRTMVPEAEALQAGVNGHDAEGHLLHKRPGDPRVTRLGRFLRRTSLDELPQLVNVLRGDMSLVGPRPELPWLVEQYEPWQRRRLVTPPGLTGWWQVSGRSELPMHLHTDVDLYYIANYSFWLDLRILWKTLWVVLQGRGAH